MVNTYIFNEIMSQKSNHSITLSISLSLISNYTTNIELLQDDKFNIYYRVLVSDLLKHDIDNDILLELNQGGWELSNDKKFLVNFIK